MPWIDFFFSNSNAGRWNGGQTQLWLALAFLHPWTDPSHPALVLQGTKLQPCNSMCANPTSFIWSWITLSISSNCVAVTGFPNEWLLFTRSVHSVNFEASTSPAWRHVTQRQKRTSLPLPLQYFRNLAVLAQSLSTYSCLISAVYLQVSLLVVEFHSRIVFYKKDFASPVLLPPPSTVLSLLPILHIHFCALLRPFFHCLFIQILTLLHIFNRVKHSWVFSSCHSQFESLA